MARRTRTKKPTDAPPETSKGLVSSVYDQGKADAKPTPGNVVTLDTGKVDRAIKAAAERITGLKAERTAINAKIKAEFDNLEPLGINRKAFKRALQRYELEQTDRETQDRSYAVACRALQIEHQFMLPLPAAAAPVPPTAAEREAAAAEARIRATEAEEQRQLAEALTGLEAQAAAARAAEEAPDTEQTEAVDPDDGVPLAEEDEVYGDEDEGLEPDGALYERAGVAVVEQGAE